MPVMAGRAGTCARPITAIIISKRKIIEVFTPSNSSGTGVRRSISLLLWPYCQQRLGQVEEQKLAASLAVDLKRGFPRSIQADLQAIARLQHAAGDGDLAARHLQPAVAMLEGVCHLALRLQLGRQQFGVGVDLERP